MSTTLAARSYPHIGVDAAWGMHGEQQSTSDQREGGLVLLAVAITAAAGGFEGDEHPQDVIRDLGEEMG